MSTLVGNRFSNFIFQGYYIQKTAAPVSNSSVWVNVDPTVDFYEGAWPHHQDPEMILDQLRLGQYWYGPSSYIYRAQPGALI